MRSFWSWTMYHPAELPWGQFCAGRKRRSAPLDAARPINAQPEAFADLPDTMTQFRKPTQAHAEVRALLSACCHEILQ